MLSQATWYVGFSIIFKLICKLINSRITFLLASLLERVKSTFFFAKQNFTIFVNIINS